VSFTIPSLYVQASTWYPVDPSYFIQIVNYVVPSRDEYEVNTHFMEVGKDVVVNRFEDIFQEKIQGCTLRLIQTQKELSSIKLIDSYTFADTPRIDKLEFRFSIGGKYFAIFSKENNFFRVYAPENIEKIFDEIRKNKSIFEVKNNENIEDITFGNN
jgi:transcriptional regulator of heat shock response